MEWYAVRSVFHFGVKSDGTNIFEERIVGFCAENVDEAFAKAEKESDDYGRSLDFKVHIDMEAYTQDGDPLVDGYELWSQLYESRETLEEFYESRYGKYKYYPEKP